MALRNGTGLEGFMMDHILLGRMSRPERHGQSPAWIGNVSAVREVREDGTTMKAAVVDPSSEGSDHLDIQRLDVAWNGAVDDTTGQAPVVVDLRKVEYIDQECLLFLVAIIIDRWQRHAPFSLRLPTQSATLDFLRAWDFPGAISLASDDKLDFEDVLDEESRKLFGDAKERPPRYLKVTTLDSGGRETLLPLSFFAITPVVLTNPRRAATLVRDTWLDSHLVEVLNRHLDGYGSRVATNVLHEAVLNAAMHPHATVAFTSSQLLARPKPSREPIHTGDRELVVCVWDDGLSYADTLEQAWLEHGTVASPAYGRVDDMFEFQVIDRPGGRSKVEFLSSTDAIETFREPFSRVLSAFLLGVTATPKRIEGEPGADKTEMPATEDLVPADVASYSGLGLHVIRRTVVDQFSGSLLYAAGPMRLTISPGDRTGTYKAQLVRRLASDARAAGNLLVARMRLPTAKSE